MSVSYDVGAAWVVARVVQHLPGPGQVHADHVGQQALLGVQIRREGPPLGERRTDFRHPPDEGARGPGLQAGSQLVERVEGRAQGTGALQGHLDAGEIGRRQSEALGCRVPAVGGGGGACGCVLGPARMCARARVRERAGCRLLAPVLLQQPLHARLVEEPGPGAADRSRHVRRPDPVLLVVRLPLRALPVGRQLRYRRQVVGHVAQEVCQAHRVGGVDRHQVRQGVRVRVVHHDLEQLGPARDFYLRVVRRRQLHIEGDQAQLAASIRVGPVEFGGQLLTDLRQLLVDEAAVHTRVQRRMRQDPGDVHPEGAVLVDHPPDAEQRRRAVRFGRTEFQGAVLASISGELCGSGGWSDEGRTHRCSPSRTCPCIRTPSCMPSQRYPPSGTSSHAPELRAPR